METIKWFLESTASRVILEFWNNRREFSYLKNKFDLFLFGFDETRVILIIDKETYEWCIIKFILEWRIFGEELKGGIIEGEGFSHGCIKFFCLHLKVQKLNSMVLDFSWDLRSILSFFIRKKK